MCCPAETQAVGHIEEDINVILNTSKQLLTRAHSKDRNVSERVNTLRLIEWKGTIDDDTIRLTVLGIGVVVIAGAAGGVGGGQTGAVLVNSVVFTTIGGSSGTGEESITGGPVGGEVGAFGVSQVTGVDVLGKTGLFVDTDGVTLLTLVGLGGHVLCVNGTHDVEAVTVVGGDDDEGVGEFTEVLEFFNGGLDGIVEFEEVTEGTVVVEEMHHLIDRGGFGHEEPTLGGVTLVGLGAGVEDVNGLEGHFLETGLVSGIALVTRWVVALVLKVFLPDVTVKPLGHVGDGEDTKGTLGVRGGLEGGIVQVDSVSFFGEFLVVVLVLVGFAAGIELLSTTTEEDIGAVPVNPAVVGGTVKEGIDTVWILATATGVGGQTGWGGISNGSGTDDTNVSTVDTVEELDNGLNLRVVEDVGAGVNVCTKSIDSSLVAGVQSSGRVGRVGDEGINGVSHGVAEDWKLVHGHLGLVLAVLGLVSDETSSSDHVGGHSVPDEEEDVPCLPDLLHLADGPGGSGGLAIILEGGLVFTGLIKVDLSVGLGGDVDNGWLASITGKVVLEPSEGPLLELRFGNLEPLGTGKDTAVATNSLDGELEVLVWVWVSGSLGSVNRSMDFETDIESLTSKEISLIWRKNTSQIRTGTQTLKGLGRDEADKDRDGGNWLGENNHFV